MRQGAATASLAETFRAFLTIGLMSFGGPAGQIALMHRMLVEERRWVSEDQFLHGLNFCTLLPGPEAMQLATYIGWLRHGVLGGLIAGVLFVAPGFCVILALSMLYAQFESQTWFTALFFGLKAAVLAVVLEALVRVAKKSLRGGWAHAIAAASFLALFAFRVPFPLVVLAAGIAGWALAGRLAGVSASGTLPAADVPVPGWHHIVTTLAIWGGLWAALPLAMIALFGAGTVFPALAVFFSKMAVVTFGGAYAVLAYVAQAAVETYGWLKPGQMIDGLALAETTPGPLILVLSFVGFLAAYQAPATLPPLLAGVLGAVMTTWVTFIPCFLWIFLGAPFLERVRHNPALKGALAGIGAAVVGVILNLSLWFALQTLFARVGEVAAGPLRLHWPEWTSLDGQAAVLTILAMVALFRLHLGMIPVLGLCAVLGVALRLI
ncbi:MAG TPA: chromate efflux transporter [Beijerinckiaceae bacterium]|nr:chromate efflux transporter [Beijerinckiaceae bacterium]